MDVSSVNSALQESATFSTAVGILISIVSIILLLLLSAIASGFGAALSCIEKADLLSQSTESKRNKRTMRLYNDGERTAATILSLNCFANVGIIMLGYGMLRNTINFGGYVWINAALQIIVLSIIVLLFGEIIPNAMARKSPMTFLRRWVNTIYIVHKMLLPITSLLSKGKSLTERVISNESPVLSADDLEQVLELANKEITGDGQDILQGIIRFGDETARNAMTLRPDMVTLDISADFDEVLHCIVENNYSRIPISVDTTDNIRGILYIKDLLPHLSKGRKFRWQVLIRPPYFVPETKKLDDLLREFQKSRVHMAIVVDEYGGTSGLITLEDILEEIIGEINDEYDEEEKDFVRLNANTYLFEGKTLLSDFCKVFDLDSDEFDDVDGDANTIAGILLELKGDILHVHEKIDYHNFTFEVLELDERRISKVKVILHKPIE